MWETLKAKFAFLSSTRFWALVIAGLVIVANGNFTQQAWVQGLLAVLGGFIGVRTIDRASEMMGGIE